jgi:Lon protease-like protein
MPEANATAQNELALFPLRTVLYPGGELALRIFEPRYLDMVACCAGSNTPFGVLLICEGAETGPARTFTVGTTAHIADWHQRSDGLLGVTAKGHERFRLLTQTRRDDGLYVGRVEMLEPDGSCVIPEARRMLAVLLATARDELEACAEERRRDYDDAAWVSYRLAELLPLALEQMQSLLETNDPLQRLDQLARALEEYRPIRAGVGLGKGS